MKIAWYAEMDFSPINIRCSGAWGEGSGVQQRTSEPEPKNKTQSSQLKSLNYGRRRQSTADTDRVLR